jgi:hypothetical protein
LFEENTGGNKFDTVGAIVSATPDTVPLAKAIFEAADKLLDESFTTFAPNVPEYEPTTRAEIFIITAFGSVTLPFTYKIGEGSGIVSPLKVMEFDTLVVPVIEDEEFGTTFSLYLRTRYGTLFITSTA